MSIKILGIVGEICAGKTTVAKQLVYNYSLCNFFTGGIVYLEGDSEIRKMYTKDLGIIEKIKSVYPKCVQNNIVDTKILGEFFFASKQNQKIIENITHPALKDEIIDFIDKNNAKNVLLILDVPVLFKLSLDQFCNYIIFFSAQKEERINRGITRIIQKHTMTQNEAKKRFLDIDKIALKQSDFNTDFIFVDTTNYDNNQEITIEKTIEKITTLFLQ